MSMNRPELRDTSGHECDLCHNQYPVMMACGSRILCTNCFMVETHHEEEEYGNYRDDFTSLTNE